MRTDVDLAYWDSCLFLDYLNATPNGKEIVAPLVDEARRGGFTIVTSTISLAEVAYVSKELTEGLDPQIDDAIDNMFRDGSLLTLVEYDQEIGADARRLIRRTVSEDKRLKPADAIHLATAIAVGASVLYTFDSDLIGYANTLGVILADKPEPPEFQPQQGQLLE